MKNAFNRTVSLVLAALTAFGLFVFSPAASAYVYGDFTYTVYAGEATINSYKGSASQIDIPAKISGYPVTKIRSYAFKDRTALKKVTIPDGVVSIGRNAFSGCTELSSVTIPDSVTSVGVLAFDNTKITKNGIGADESGVIYIGNFLILARGDVYGTYKVKSGTVAIADNAFKDCALLSGVTLPNTLRNIGNSAFSGCKGLKSFKIPSSVRTIGGRALYNCSGIKSLEIPDGVVSIGGNAFYGTGLWADASKWEDGVLYIGKYLIKAKNDTASYFKIKDGTACIADGAFMNFKSLKSVSLPDTVTNVVYSAFYNCASLRKVFYSGTEEQWSEVRVEPNNQKLTKAAFVFGKEGPAQVDPERDFTYTYAAGKVTITGYTGQTEDLDIPSVLDGKPVAEIGQGAFEGCSALTSVTVPDSVTSIRYRAFYGCPNLIDVYLPKSVSRIEGLVFTGCASLTAIYTDEENTKFSSYEGALYDKAKRTLVAFPAGADTVKFPDTLTLIGNDAFSGCAKIKSVRIPSGVTDIGAAAFSGCTALKSVTFPETLTGIGEGAFRGCTALEKVAVPSRVREIQSSSFEGCRKLSSVTLPEGLTAIGAAAFKGCSEITGIEIPTTVSLIGAEAFSGCTGLTELVLPEGVKTVGSGAFSGCSSISVLRAPESLRSVGVNAFSGCSALKTVYYAGSESGWAERVAVESGNSPLLRAKIIFAKKSTFSDVPDKAYFADAVIWAVENGITEGTGAGKFSPDLGCTRGQVVTFLWRAAGKPEPENSVNPFSDVSEADYYFKAVLWAVEKGITKGTGASTFSPGATCTRGQIVTFLWRAQGSPEQPSVGNPFSDVKKSDYFYTAVLWAIGGNVTKGTSADAFSPGNTCTRAQVVTFLSRAMRK